MTRLMRAVRRVIDLGRGPVAVTLYPDGHIGFRPRRHRTEFRLPLGSVMVRAVDAHVQQAKAERRAARHAMRKG